MRNILCNVHRPIPILVAKVWQRKLDYAKNLQAKYFTGENIQIYGIYRYNVCCGYMYMTCEKQVVVNVVGIIATYRIDTVAALIIQILEPNKRAR